MEVQTRYQAQIVFNNEEVDIVNEVAPLMLRLISNDQKSIGFKTPGGNVRILSTEQAEFMTGVFNSIIKATSYEEE